MGYGDRLAMQMPQLCARCGEVPPSTSYGTSSKHRPFGSNITQTLDYSVPVCVECEAKIARRDKNAKIAMGIGIVIFLIGLGLMVPYFLAMRDPENALRGGELMNQYWPYGLVALLGLAIGMIARNLAEPNFAKWNGKLLHFNNKAFHAAFAGLNPGISRKV